MADNAVLIYKQMAKVMADIGVIGKDRKNTQQNYMFRGIDDVYNAAQCVMAKHEVICVPEVLEWTKEERETKSGTAMMYVIARIKYTFFAADGSNVTMVTLGEAMDSGDKACNKAMSTAQKYAFFQGFLIPTDEPKDTENESPEVKAKPQTPPAKREHWCPKHNTEYFMRGNMTSYAHPIQGTKSWCNEQAISDEDFANMMAYCDQQSVTEAELLHHLGIGKLKDFTGTSKALMDAIDQCADKRGQSG